MPIEQNCNKSRIPICLVTGFLGSGKTTFLKNIVESHRDRKLVYLVNEFSPHDIDGAIVSETNPNVVAIPGGSIFCKCLVTEFIGRLESIPKSFDNVDGVVIEASGMANPKVLDDMLRETKLDDRYVIAHIVSIVDPGSFLKLRVTLPNIVAQIEASDTALINKSDIFDTDIIKNTRNALTEIKPNLNIYTCTHAKVDFDLFTPSTERDSIHGEYAKCKDPNYDSLTVQIENNIDVDTLRNRLLEVEDDFYRMKGYVPSDRGTIYCEYTKAGFTQSNAPNTSDHTLVLIMRGNPSPAARDFVEWLSA